MKLTRTLAALCALASLHPAAFAGTHDVPGTFPKIQDAVDAAAPGDTIVIQAGWHLGATIDKPLHLVGAGVGEVLIEAPSHNTVLDLIGPGAGRVTIANVTLVSSYGGSPTQGFLRGGGFDSLQLNDVRIEPQGAFDGSYAGGPGLDLDIPLIVLIDSYIEAGQPNAYENGGAFPPHVGISAPNSTIVLIDSVVHGSEHFYSSEWASHWGGSPAPGYQLPDPFGHGGLGIEAKRVIETGSVIAGGKGEHFVSLVKTLDFGVYYLGQEPDGQAMVAQQHLGFPADSLGALGQPQVGQDWILTSGVASTTGTLFLASGSTLPLLLPDPLPAQAFFLLDPAAIFAALPVPSAVGTPLPIPLDASLVGESYWLQSYDPLTQLASRPLHATVQP